MATNQDGYVSNDADTQAKIKAMQSQAVAKSSQASLPPEDAANAAKFSTPLPPNDPASLRGSRESEFYIGPTNFSKIQQKYTPYQIEQATTRNANGDIFWNPNVDINTIPPSRNGTAGMTTPKPEPLPTGQATTTSTSMSSSASTDFTRAQGEASQRYLTGIQSTIDGLLAKQQEMQAQAKAESEAKVGGLMDRLRANLDGSQYQKSLARDRQLFEVQKNINTLNTIRTRLADATAALEQGLIYEESRPVRMALLVGRSAELKKQGIAQINALQGAAEVVKGNIELARAYADDSIAAIKADNAEKNAALNTLLDLENAKLIRLTDDEKDTIAERRKLLQDEAKRLDDNREKMFDLAIKFPSAFASSGATFADNPEEAMQKMIPKMAADEKELLDLEIAQKRATLAKTKSSGSGGGSGGGSAAENNIYEAVAYLQSQRKEDGTPYSEEEIRQLVGSRFQSSMKRTDLVAYIENALKGGGSDRTPEQQLKDAASQELLSKQQSGDLVWKFDAEKGQMVLEPKQEEKRSLIDRWRDYWNGSNPEDQFTITE